MRIVFHLKKYEQIKEFDIEEKSLVYYFTVIYMQFKRHLTHLVSQKKRKSLVK